MDPRVAIVSPYFKRSMTTPDYVWYNLINLYIFC